MASLYSKYKTFNRRLDVTIISICVGFPAWYFVLKSRKII